MVAMTGGAAPGGTPGAASGRRVYWSDPDAPDPGQQLAECSRVERQVYLAARAGSLEPEVAFDLAASLVDVDELEPLARDLAEQAADGGEQVRISELALRLLSAAGFRPGFREEPPLLEALEQALRVVEADVRATGLDGDVGLILNDWDEPEQTAHAVYQGGGSGSTVGMYPSEAGDPVYVLVAVADDLQNSIMHMLWGTVWPVCPAHNLGAHAREHEGVAVWWCNGAGGHVITPIGHWND